MEQELTLKQRKKQQRQLKAQSLLIDTVSYEHSQAYRTGLRDLREDDSNSKTFSSPLSNETTPKSITKVVDKITLPKRQLSQNRNSILTVSPAYKQRSKSAKTTGIESPTIENNANNGFGYNNMRNFSPEIDQKADTIKLLLLGDTNVGKTAIILRYCNELKLTKINRTKEQHLERTESKLFGSSIDKETSLDFHIRSSRNLRNTQILDSSDRGSLAHKSTSSSVRKLQHRKEKAYSLSDYEKLHEELPIEEGDDVDDYEIATGSTIGIDIKTQLINLDNRFFKVILWDTAGQERFRQALNPLMYKKTQGLVLVYDITSLKSFESLWDYWIIEWLKNNQYKNGYEKNSKKKGRIYLVGNKTDLYKEREVNHEHVLKFMFKLEAQYGDLLSIGGNFEVSCKVSKSSSSGGVEVAFERIIQDLVSRGCYGSVAPDTASESDEETADITLEAKNSHKSVVDLTKGSGDGNNSLESFSLCCF
ncbi:hypothetical protein QEN19_004065 [Hanseniaspora menglaensis]